MCTSGIMYEEEFLEDGIDDIITTPNKDKGETIED